MNARTIATTGYSPSFEIRAYATFLNEEELEADAPPLSFIQALDTAQYGNMSLSVEEMRVQSSMKDKDIARSPLLPQILAGASYQNQKLRCLS